MALETGRRTFLHMLGTIPVAGYAGTMAANAAEEPPKEYPDRVKAYLKRLYSESNRRFAFRADYPGGFDQWQKEARAELIRLLGLDRIARQNESHTCAVTLEESLPCEGYIRRRGSIQTELDVSIPFWLLIPDGKGPFPLAVTPHGHSKTGMDVSAGLFKDEKERIKIETEDRDVAVQAVRRGYIAIAPATRGLSVDGVPDIKGRHGQRDCRSQLIHCIFAGRTPLGERVWDMQKIIDWALTHLDVNKNNILMMGNSGGGMVSTYAPACDTRITVGVSSCAFSVIAGPDGYIYHCDCNAVPGILEFGDLYDVAGLIAPRCFLAVNGKKDSLHSNESIEYAANRLKSIYEASGHPECFEHRWGEEGHRFYKDLMWPFITQFIQM